MSSALLGATPSETAYPRRSTNWCVSLNTSWRLMLFPYNGATRAMLQGRDILVGSTDQETVQAAGWRPGDPVLLARQHESLRLGILFSARQALVPAGGYFEALDPSPFLALRPSQERGQIAFHGFGANPFDYVNTKLSHWRGNDAILRSYEKRGSDLARFPDSSAWRPKNEATDARLRVNWRSAVAAGRHPLLHTWARARYSTDRAARAVAALPDELAGAAMLTRNVAALLPGRLRAVWNYVDEHGLRVHLALGFFESYLAESSAIALTDTPVGVQDGVFPAFAPRVNDQKLRELLAALDVRDSLLSQIQGEEFAALVETQTWRCLRSELMARVSDNQPFSRRELKALKNARKVKKGHTAVSIESQLAWQHEALEKVSDSSIRASTVELLGKFGEAMAASSQAPPLRGELARTLPPSEEHLSQMLLDLLECSTVADAQNRINRIELVMSQHGSLHASRVKRLVIESEDLREKARRLPVSVKTALVNIGTGATGSVVAQGLVAALRTLGT